MVEEAKVLSRRLSELSIVIPKIEKAIEHIDYMSQYGHGLKIDTQDRDYRSMGFNISSIDSKVILQIMRNDKVILLEKKQKELSDLLCNS